MKYLVIGLLILAAIIHFNKPSTYDYKAECLESARWQAANEVANNPDLDHNDTYQTWIKGCN